MEIKEQILKLLKEPKSTTEIAETLKINYYRIKNLLKEMESEKRITKTVMGRYTYWRKTTDERLET